MKCKQLARRVSVVVVVAVLGASLLGCKPKVWVESSEHLELSAVGIQTLEAQTHNGYIHIVAASTATDKIRIDITKKLGGDSDEDAAAAMEAIQTDVTQSGGIQNLKYSWRESKRPGWVEVISYDVTLPEAMALRLETHNGEVTVQGVKGNTSIETYNGDIDIRKGEGTLSAVTHNGEIDVDTMGAEVSLETHNGSITAKLSREGAIRGTILTHNGEVRVLPSASACCRIEARTDNGQITVRPPVTNYHKTRTSMDGQLGEGGGLLTVETHNGSIAIE